MKILIEESTLRQALSAIEALEIACGDVDASPVKSKLVAAPDGAEKVEPVLWGCKFNLGNRIDTFYTEKAAKNYVEKSLRNGANVSLISLFTHPAPTNTDELRDSIIEECAEICEQEIRLSYDSVATQENCAAAIRALKGKK